METEILNYKGRNLVRCKDDLFYGNVSESKITFLHIDSRNQDNFQTPNKVSVGLVGTLAASRGNIFKPFKFSIKDSLFEALDLACAWLDRQSLTRVTPKTLPKNLKISNKNNKNTNINKNTKNTKNIKKEQKELESQKNN